MKKNIQAEKRSSLLNKLQRAANEYGKFHYSEDFYAVNPPEKCQVAMHPLNREKNRGNYWGLPYDHNLVRTIPLYVNASPMKFGKHRYIAAQGPRQNTFHEFWQMVWEEKVALIVSVTNEREDWKGKEMMKFERFWSDDCTLQFGKLTLRPKKNELLQEWADGRKEKIRLRAFDLDRHDETRSIYHLHMENWRDNGVIHPESLYALSRAIDDWNQQGPIVVHCAAGVGRTGTVIAFHSLFHEMLDHIERDIDVSFDLVERVEEMRRLRWGSMIGSEKQFALIIEALHLALQQYE